MDAFAPHAEAVARHFWGDPNPQLSSATELRFGSHGARSVDLEKGVWFDNEVQKGGGVLDLVEREQGVTNGAAVTFLRELGLAIADDRQPASGSSPSRTLTHAYDYVDEAGEILFQVCRFQPKDFRQRRPDPSAKDGWNWSVKGVRPILYRLPEVIEAIAMGRTVFIVEGEKDVDRLWALDVAATCNAGGAGKWSSVLTEHLRGADVVLLPDNDDAGRNHAAVVGASLKDVACSVNVLDLPGLPPKGDATDWLNAGNGAVQLYDLVERTARPWRPAAPESRFGAVLWTGLDAVKGRHDWLVDGMMFCGDLGLSYGASQSGKSFLSVDMGLAIARGEPFLGKRTKKGAVLYQAGEGGLGLISRLKAYRQYHGLAAKDLPFVLLPSRVDLYAHDGDADAFLSEILAFKAWLTEPLALVVIDTFATASPGANENASEDVSRVLRNAQRIQEEAGCAVLLVHHKNASGEKPRGHTSLYANADTALEVSRDPENPTERTLHVAKVKDGEDGEKIGFRLQSVEIGSYDDGKPMTSCVVVPAQDGDQRTGDRPDKRSPSSAQLFFLRALSAAITQKGGIVPLDACPIPGTHGVAWHDFVAHYAAADMGDRNDEAIRKQILRDGEKLLNWGMIGRSKPWVWLTSKGGRAAW